MNAIALGPVVLPVDRLAMACGAASLLLVSAILSRRVDRRFDAWASATLLAGFAASRLGHVALNWRDFAEEPWRALAIWQGGFSLAFGMAAALGVTAIYARTAKFAAGAAGALAAAALASLAALALAGATGEKTAPSHAMATLDGQRRSIADFGGRPIVVNLWASWCPPCLREMPLLARTAEQRPEIPFLFVNQGESAEAVTRYLGRAGLSPGNVLLDRTGELPRNYDVVGLPVTLFLRRDGSLSSVHTGEISREALRAGIDRIASPAP